MELPRPSARALAALLLAACLPARAQTPTVSVAPFAGDADGAVSYTFDDGSQNQSTLAAKLLEDQGFRGTFYLIAGYTHDRPGDPLDPRIPSSENWARVSWEEWIAMERRGHELGCHTLTHAHIVSLDSAHIQKEVDSAMAVMKRKTGNLPLTFAHPYNQQGALADRIVLRRFPMFRTNWTLFGTGYAASVAQMNAVLDDAVKKKSLVAVEIHGLDEPWAPMSSQNYRQHLAYARQAVADGKVWIATYWKAARYVKARDSTAVAVTEKTATRVVFAADCRARAVVCDDSLTFSIAVTGVTKAWGLQGGKSLPVVFKAGKILVSAVPGSGPVTVDWGGGPATVAPALAREIRAGGKTVELPRELGTGAMRLELCDLRGRVVWQRTLAPGFSPAIKIDGVTPGIYALHMRGSLGTATARVLMADP